MSILTHKVKTKAEKKTQDALSTLRWSPYLIALVLALIVMQAIGLAKHPGLEHLIRLIGPIGIMLSCLAYRSRALLVLNGGKNTWQMSVLLIGLLLTGAGPSLGDMYHHKHMFLFLVLGLVTMTLVLFLLAMLAWEAVDVFRTAHPRRAFTMPPSQDDIARATQILDLTDGIQRVP